MIRILLPRTTWRGEQIEEIYHLFQRTPELGFVRKESIRDHIRQNKERGTIWGAYSEGGQLLGIANIGGRHLYPHLFRHGEVGVIRPYRRRRIGTCLYFAQILQSLLEGRRLVEDTIIPDYSPWMVGPSCNNAGMGFLPFLGYKHYGTLPQRTSAFRDVELWGGETLKLVRRYLECIDETSTFELIDTSKTRATFNKNLQFYRTHIPDKVHEFYKARAWVLDNFEVEVVSDGEEVINYQ